MQNFQFYNPVNILFGKGQIAQIAQYQARKQTGEAPSICRAGLENNGGHAR